MEKNTDLVMMRNRDFNLLISEDLKRMMRPHQLTAYQFLMNNLLPNYGDRSGGNMMDTLYTGSILADDVGTGKVCRKFDHDRC